MEIDIKPKKVTANDIEKIYLEMRNCKRVYQFIYKNGEKLSTVFTEAALKLFLPSSNVSTFIKQQQDSNEFRIKKLEKSIETREHDIWTTRTKRPDGTFDISPFILDDDAIEVRKKELIDLKSKKGKIKFVEIVEN